MIRVLLTGANGQLGREIQRTVPNAVELFSYDKPSLDITSIHAVRSVFAKCKPDYVINTAAYTAVDRAEIESELAFAINVDGVAYLAEECYNASIPLIHISTDYVFNGHHDKPYVETDAAMPLSVYGKSKWAGEQAIRSRLAQHIILRTSWVFSPFGRNFVKTILQLAKDKSILHVVSDQYGCPTSGTDVASAIWEMVRQINQGNTAWGTYHFTNIPQITWYDFAKKILTMAEHSSRVIAISTSDYPTLAKRPAYSVLNCEKMMRIFQIAPRYWEMALKEIINCTEQNTYINN